MLNFCTLFDSNYLTRGLAMYRSLEKHCKDFHLYIFAFDDKAASTLDKLKLQHATIITLEKFEDEKLLAIKPTRTRGEYCWTCTPSTVLYVLQNYDVDCCTYVDADIFFFSDPKILLDEMEEKSILLTEHRYPEEYNQSDKSGKYCVQFTSFKNNETGLQALKWWRDACIDWCYDRIEEGKFGDQKYLDDWLTKFPGVCELQNLGGGVAPWNITQYNFKQVGDKISGTKKDSGEHFLLNFYHFHSLKFISKDLIQLVDKVYQIDDETLKLIYTPYQQTIENIDNEIERKFGKNFLRHNEMKTDFLKKIRITLCRKHKNTIHKKWLTSSN